MWKLPKGKGHPMTEPTKRPWRLDTYAVLEPGGFDIVGVCSNNHGPSLEDAELIVLCVNMHAGFVAACKRARTLPSGATLVAMSSTMGCPSVDGAPIEIGLVEIRPAVPPKGATNCPPPPAFTVTMPTMPTAAAISA